MLPKILEYLFHCDDNKGKNGSSSNAAYSIFQGLIKLAVHLISLLDSPDDDIGIYPFDILMEILISDKSSILENCDDLIKVLLQSQTHSSDVYVRIDSFYRDLTKLWKGNHQLFIM